jgi:hypothetical protein
MEDFEFVLEEEATSNGQEQQTQETQTPVAPAEETQAQTVVEDEPEVVFEDDKEYNKKDWKIDPVTNAEDKNDDQFSKDVQKRIGTLRASLTEAGRQRDVAARDNAELQRYAQHLKSENENLRKQLHTGKLSTLESQAAAHEAQAKAARKEVEEAINTGNTAALLDAQERMQTANAKAVQYRREVETTPKEPVAAQQPEYVPVQQQKQVPQVDTTKRDKWASENPWFAMDEFGVPENIESATAIKAHHAAIRAGAQEGSDAYFAHINNTVKAAHPKLFTQRQAAASTVVPSSRVSTGQQTNGAGKQRVIIKAETEKLARSMGLTTPEEIKAFAIEQHKSMTRGAN